MKNTHKKLIGGLFVALLIAIVGAAFASGQADDTSDDMIPQIPFGERHGMNRFGPFASELIDEQRAELKELLNTLRDQNATLEEIRTAIQEKLDEYGVLDARLDTAIAQTEQRLIILNRQKELRNEGYSLNEIRNTIKNEFDLENSTGIGWNMMYRHDIKHGPCGGPRGFITSEESDQ